MEKKFDVNRDLGVEPVDWDKVNTDPKRLPPRYPSEFAPAISFMPNPIEQSSGTAADLAPSQQDIKNWVKKAKAEISEMEHELCPTCGPSTFHIARNMYHHKHIVVPLDMLVCDKCRQWVFTEKEDEIITQALEAAEMISTKREIEIMDAAAAFIENDTLDAPLQAPEEKGAKYNPRTQKFELPNE